MKINLRILMALCIYLALPSIASATLIEFECTYDYIRVDKFNNFVIKLETNDPELAQIYKQKTLWDWNFWFSDKKLYYAIDAENKTMIHGQFNIGAPQYVIAVYPDLITIDINYFDTMTNKFILSGNYTINRINGEFVGTEFATGHDRLLNPYFKKGEEMWTLNGSCKHIYRKF